MRLQLMRSFATLLFVLAMGAIFLGTARAENLPQNPTGEAVFRGSYWRDRNTRVLNPSADLREELPSGVSLGAHYLLDAITSASIAAGASSDQPFTELRHEAGFNVAVPLPDKNKVSVSYNYSTESDYFSHQLGLRGIFNLFQDNSTLLIGIDYAHNTVGKRLGPTGYLLMGNLDTAHLALLWTQTLTRKILISGSYELTLAQGYQNNPYRPVFVRGVGGVERRETEHLPTSRERHVLAVNGHFLFPTAVSLVPHVTLRPGLRIHHDSWGLTAWNPEVATYIPVGPTEFRVLLSIYTQSRADFYRSDGECLQNYVADTPAYCQGSVPLGDSRSDPAQKRYYTSDVKLGSYSTYTLELMWKWRLSFFRRLGAFGERLSRTVLELGGGMWFADRADGWQYGMPLTGDDPSAPAGCSAICGAFFANFGVYVPL